MRSPLWVLSLALAACSADGAGAPKTSPPPAETAPAGAPAGAPKLPNIVLFSIDTLRADRLGMAGRPGDITPRLDAFGRDAVVFDRAVSPAPSTTPSHMSVFTGLAPSVHGVVNVDREHPVPSTLAPGVRTLPERLREAGYVTVGLHGGGNVDGSLGFDRGFDFYSQDFISYNWVKAYEEPSDLDVVRHWLRIGKERGRPLFLFLHHYVCHVPYISAPEAIRQRFLAGKKVPGLTEGPSDAVLEKAAEAFGRVPESRARLKDAMGALAARFRPFWTGVDLSRPDHRAHIEALYDASVAYADLLFGRVMDLLAEEGAYRDSIIVLMSDHGEEFFEHGGREHGRLFTEHLHVPLMIRFPDGTGIAPRRVREPVRLFDILPTVMEKLGIPAGFPVQAESFLGLIDGRGGYAPTVASYNGPKLQLMRIEKGGLSWADEGYQDAAQTLFDLRADPAERDNLASQRPDDAAEMARIAAEQRARDAEFRESSGRAGMAPAVPDPRIVEQLEALGYLDP